ncbi:MAG: T9SS type A sorting domain-containing protein [Bacteroidetes bacterium]|nr:T9SS type A sorting domain-containing protein [Bacteroidota bacterium]
MKTNATFRLITGLLFSASVMFAQERNSIIPYSATHELKSSITTIVMPNHDFTQDIKEAEEFEKNGNYPRFARHFDINRTLLNSGTWTEVGKGDRIWQLKLKSNGALSTGLFFEDFWLPEGSSLTVYSPDLKQIYSYDYSNNQGNKLFSTEFIQGEEQIIEYFEPAEVRDQGSLRITSLSHQYRSVLADPCEVNIICTPEGTNWQDEKKGVCRIYVVEGSQAGYCSGTLINNTSLDCKRYILTAFHCGVSATTTNFNSWVFRFNFEATQCTGQADTFGANNAFTGCSKKADSGDNGGDTGSDFLLLEMTSTATPTWWSGVYWNGWINTNTAPTGGGVGIHHPAGSNKKISTFSATPTSQSWGGSTPNTHWRFSWIGTTNGWGVTEGGSSGSPIFNSSGLVFGTLTGGSSYCNSVQAGGQTQPDLYGKLSYHWTSNGTTSNRQLKPWLDPGNTGATSLNGSYSPCTATSVSLIENSNIMSVYPNPSNGQVNIQINLKQTENYNINIFNSVGELVVSKRIENSNGGNFEFQLSGQSAGIYLIEVVTLNFRETKKVMITK